uniref:NADH-ubiquinone oxidoreductase chain 6 n=1 Tax=Pipa carvalhoi TaxID=191480 RepID=F6KDA7_9PIPI|nr:NADH dehydrogenase subunit 6 [Pipa carvalhoi]ADM35694.1 NADH dehydrogenase subunit 6 [Pipa carvalhoi]
MTYVMTAFLVSLIFGLIAVASNPSPYFAALGLVMAAGAGCWVILGLGTSFLSLVLFLIYLGGMLVVFAYSAALTAEPYPEAWGSWSVAFYVAVYLVGVAVAYFVVGGIELGSLVPVGVDWAVVKGDWGGVAMLYGVGGWLLVVSGWVLLLTLFVVLEVSRGQFSGTLRAV